jgi:regulator of replication initiation timing
MVTGFDPDTIKDLEGARAAISYLLNAVEAMKVQVDQLRAENQRLRDENNRLKGEQGQPQLKANKKEQPPATIPRKKNGTSQRAE